MNGILLSAQLLLSGDYGHLLEFLVNPEDNLSLINAFGRVLAFAGIANILYYIWPLNRPKCANLYAYLGVMVIMALFAYISISVSLESNLNDGLFTVVNAQTGVTECLVRESEIELFAIAASVLSVLVFLGLSLGFRKVSINNRRIPF